VDSDKLAKEIFEQIIVPQNEIEYTLLDSIRFDVREMCDASTNISELTEDIFDVIYYMITRKTFEVFNLTTSASTIAVNNLAALLGFVGEYGEILYRTIEEADGVSTDEEIDAIYRKVTKLSQKFLEKLLDNTSR
jgi:hypothetical protein